MKKQNLCKVVLLTAVVFLILTWILPAASFQSEYAEQGRIQMGLFDIFNYPTTALSAFAYVILFFVFVGGFYGVLFKIPAYRSFLDKIAFFMKGTEKIFLSIVILLIALLVSICGLNIGIAVFVPFIVSIIFLMGYDKIVAAYTIVGSICAGMLGSTYASSHLNILLSGLSLNTDYQIGVRFILLFVSVVLVIFNMIRYMDSTKMAVIVENTNKKNQDKVKNEDVVKEKIEVKSSKESASTKKSTSKKTTTKSKTQTKKSTSSRGSKKNNNKAALVGEDVIIIKNDDSSVRYVPESDNNTHMIWPFVVLFLLLFIVMVLAFIPWSVFNIKLFDNITQSIQKFTIFKFPIFSKILGNVNSFGNWTVVDLILPMALTSVLLMLIYNISFDDAIDGFVKGAKRAIAPSVITILIYSILVLVVYHPFPLVIYKFILGFTKSFNIFTTAVVSMLCGLFHSDASYSFQSIVPYYVSVIKNSKVYADAAIIFQSMYGFTMLFAPTSLVLMATLSYLKVSYGEWLKNCWKLLLELFVILFIAFIALSLL